MNDRKRAQASWAATILVCAYCVWAHFYLLQTARDLTFIYIADATDMPLATRLVLSARNVFFLGAFFIVAASLIVKELVMKNKAQTLAITMGTWLAVLLVVSAMQAALLAPFRWLVHKLS